MRFLNSDIGSGVKQPAKILFCIDREPSAEQPILGGWVTSRALPIKLQLRLDGRSIHEFACAVPRTDVFKGFPDIPGSLLSGFELSLPENALREIGSGRLTVVAVGPEGEQHIWSWQGGERNNATSAIAISDHFLSRGKLEELSSLEPIGLAGEVSMSTVVSSHGVYSLLLKTLNQLQKLFTKCEAAGLKLNHKNQLVLVPNEQEKLRTSAFLERNGSSLKVIPQIVVEGSYQGWNGLAKERNEKSHLVFYVEEGIDLGALDLATLIKDFAELSTVNLLMPTLYDEKLGIQGPAGISPRELRGATSVRGANIPVLYPTKRVGPAWLSSLEFLNKTQVKTALRPAEGLFLYHVDLRQVVTSADLHVEFLSAEDRSAISLITKHELEVKKNKEATRSIVILLSTEDKLKGRDHLFEKQIFKFAESLEKDGVRVKFVQDSVADEGRYFYGHAVQSLTDYLIKSGENSQLQSKLEWVIATSWEQIRAANVLRYALGVKVGFYIDEIKTPLYTDHERDNLEICRSAYRGTFLPIVNCATVQKELISVNPCASFAMNLPYVLDSTVFTNWNLTPESPTVCIGLGDAITCTSEVIGLYKEVVTELKAKLPSVKIGFYNYSPYSREIAELIELGDQTFGQLSPGEMARLFNTSSVLIDFCKRRGLYSFVADAAACGLPSVVSSENGSLEFGISVSPGVIACPASAKEIVFNVNKMLTDEIFQSELGKANREFIGKMRARFDEKILDQLDSKYQELDTKLTSERASRKNVSIVIPVYNALDATVMCLRSVLNHAPNDYQIVVVNDRSDSGTSERLQRISADNPRIQLIELPKNLGFVRLAVYRSQYAR